MLSDAIKTGIRIAAILAGVAIILTLIHHIYFPTIDLTLLTNAVGKGKAIISYYCGPWTALLDLGISLLLIKIVVVNGLRVSILAVKAIMKANGS